MERITGHYDKIILTLILCLVILFMATFTPFAESANAVAIIDDALIAIIIAGLAGVGITFVTTGSFGNLNDYVRSLLDEFATYQNTTPDAMLSGVNTGSNKLGRLLTNNRFVIFIDTFARWIVNKFSLSNNATKNVVSADSNIGGLVVYKLPFVIVSNSNSGFYSSDMQYTVILGDEDTYLYFTDINSSNYEVNLICSHESTVNKKATDHNGNVSNLRITLNQDTNNGWYRASGGSLAKNWYREIENYRVYQPSEVETYLQNHVISQGATPIDITTGVINPPLDNPDYTDGDGAIIDVGALWGTDYDTITDTVIPGDFADENVPEVSIEYESEAVVEEAVEDNSEITNLPAGTIPFTPLQLPDLQLSSIWHYVAQWITDTAIAAGSLMAIVIQEPSPMVNLFYATICLAIIFGVIKGVAK